MFLGIRKTKEINFFLILFNTLKFPLPKETEYFRRADLRTKHQVEQNVHSRFLNTKLELEKERDHYKNFWFYRIIK